MARPKSSEPVRWEDYLRPGTPTRSRAIRYIRAIDTQTGKILLTRSVGSTSKTAARALIAKLSREIDFIKIIAAKTGSVAVTEALQMKEMPLSRFFVQFWDKEASSYLLARADSGKPLSTLYVSAQAANIRNHAEPFDGFKKTALQDAGLFLIEL